MITQILSMMALRQWGIGVIVDVRAGLDTLVSAFGRRVRLSLHIPEMILRRLRKHDSPLVNSLE